ncbi:MAG: GYD domain-containing protein [Pseudomonadota bacterium]
MPHYMFTARYTSASIKAMIASPVDREAAARELAASLGATLHHLYFAFGADDVVAIVEAPDDETAAALSMSVGASGGFSAGATTRLLTSAEAQAAMAKAQGAQYAPPAG